MCLIEVDKTQTPDCISPARRGGLGLFSLYFDCVLDFSSTTSPQIFLPQKNSCDIYEKGVTNTSKNSSVKFIHSISSEKMGCFE